MHHQTELTLQNTRKPLLLVFPFDLMSHYLRCLMLVKHFEPYFEIWFADSEKYREYILTEGYGTFKCANLDTTEVMDGVRKFDFSWINEKALEAVYLDQVRVINELGPAAVIGDTSLTIKMAAEKTGVPFISLINGYMSKYYSATRKLSKTHPSFKFINVLPAVLLDLLTRQGEALAFYKVHRPFKKMRSKHKLSKEVYYLDELEGDFNLICDLPELFPQKNLPGNYAMISPLYYDAHPPTTQLAQKLDSSRKTIFVSMGSTGDWEKVKFLNHPHFTGYNVVAAGDEADVLTSKHIIKVPFVNFHEVFPCTDLVICHGGNGTIYQALVYGIPLLCITNHFEQEWNADAVERLHAGRSLDANREVSEIIEIVDHWIIKKESGINNSYTKRIKEELARVSTTVAAIATGITTLVEQETEAVGR